MKLHWLHRLLTAAVVCSAPGLAIADDAGSQPDREALFKKLDANGDGQVTESEVPEDQQRLFKRLLTNGDKDSNGQLSLAEFLEATKQDRPARAPEGQGGAGQRSPEEVFQRADANGDGKVNPDEVPEEHRDRLRQMVARADEDKDGSLTLVEFKNGWILMMTGGQAGAGSQPSRPEGRAGTQAGGYVAPLFAAIDTNGDGKLSSDEIAAASESLKKLDKDGDGIVTREEVGGAAMPAGGRPGQPTTGRTAQTRANPQAGGRPDPAAMIARNDKDGDGKISKDEAPEWMKQGFDRFDTNGDGKVDADELKASMANMGNRGAGQGGAGGGAGLEARIKELDKNGDGKISKDEAPERMQENFDKIDTNGDGFITLEEFKAMMQKMGAGRKPNAN
jgi:Ca2+-binding EF-hand superfamily protein